MPASDIGIDLGTRNSLVYSTGKGLVLQEPSVVGDNDKDTEKIRAIGEEARQMSGHVTSNMEVIRPIRQGAIADFVVMGKDAEIFYIQSYGEKGVPETQDQHLCFRGKARRSNAGPSRRLPTRPAPGRSFWWKNP